MTLRQQLLLVCLSLLILPAAVFLFVGELDRNLRQSQERETQADPKQRPYSPVCYLTVSYSTAMPTTGQPLSFARVSFNMRITR